MFLSYFFFLKNFFQFFNQLAHSFRSFFFSRYFFFGFTLEFDRRAFLKPDKDTIEYL